MQNRYGKILCTFHWPNNSIYDPKLAIAHDNIIIDERSITFVHTPLLQIKSPEVAHPVDMSVESSISVTESPSQNSRDGTLTSAPAGNGGKTATGYELVPYQPSPVLPMFHEAKRSFEFAGKGWTIHQQWNDVGLAAVVWEAVKCCLVILLCCLVTVCVCVCVRVRVCTGVLLHVCVCVCVCVCV